MSKQKTAASMFPIAVENTMVPNVLNLDFTRKRPATTSVKKSIMRWNGWVYTESGTKVSNDIMFQLVAHFTEQIATSYLKPYRSFIVEDSAFECVILPMVTRNHMLSEIIRISRRLLRKTGSSDQMICKLVSINHTFILKTDIIKGDDRVQFTSMHFNALNNVCKCCVDTKLPASGLNDIVRFGGTPCYIGKKDREIDATIRSEDNIHLMDDTTLNLIYLALKTFLEEFDNEPEVNPYEVFHNGCEMYVFKRLFKKIDKDLGWPVDLRNWIFKDRQSPCTDSFDIVTPSLISRTMKADDHEYPLIDLSEKEMSFINKYVDDRNMFSCKTSEDIKPYNLIEYLSDPPYGSIWRYPIKYDDGSIETVIATYILDEEAKSLRVYIIKEVSHGVIVYSSVDFINIDRFHMLESTARVNTSVMFTDIDEIVDSVKTLCDMTTSDMFDSKDILEMVTDILSIHVVIHDRPTRTRMVNCSRRMTDEERKRKNRSKDKDDFVVTRILKTSVEAKEYVARMTSNGYPDREYTLESWPRKGHYRKVRGGGTVWIPPTTCHRHLSLSEKEIHIKL